MKNVHQITAERIIVAITTLNNFSPSIEALPKIFGTQAGTRDQGKPMTLLFAVLVIWAGMGIALGLMAWGAPYVSEFNELERR